MAAQYINSTNIPLALAVYLASDYYDYNAEPNTISATTLLKPLRQIILSARIPQESGAINLVDMVKNRMGAAIHDAIETAWKTNKENALAALGYPKRVIDRVVVNPTPEEVEANPDLIPVYMEQRMTRKVGKWTVTGKFDFVGEGKVQDFKTTSVFTYSNQINAEKYIKQGSIYRWLDPKKITDDLMEIHYIFTDWSANRAKGSSTYPQSPTLTQKFNLMSLEETDHFIKRKLELIEQYWDAPEEDIPHCTDDELWRSDPVWKYYASADALRSSKNFNNAAEAYMHMSTKGHKGKVVEFPGTVKACQYCSAFAVCSQKDQLVMSGQLVL